MTVGRMGMYGLTNRGPYGLSTSISTSVLAVAATTAAPSLPAELDRVARTVFGAGNVPQLSSVPSGPVPNTEERRLQAERDFLQTEAIPKVSDQISATEKAAQNLRFAKNGLDANQRKLAAVERALADWQAAPRMGTGQTRRDAEVARLRAERQTLSNRVQDQERMLAGLGEQGAILRDLRTLYVDQVRALTAYLADEQARDARAEEARKQKRGAAKGRQQDFDALVRDDPEGWARRALTGDLAGTDQGTAVLDAVERVSPGLVAVVQDNLAQGRYAETVQELTSRLDRVEQQRASAQAQAATVAKQARTYGPVLLAVAAGLAYVVGRRR